MQVEQTDGNVETQPTWETTPIPEGHPQYGKYQTLGDYHKAYESSGQEAYRLKQQADQYQAQLAGYQQFVDNNRDLLQAANRQPQQMQPQNDWFGFGTEEQFNNALRLDKAGTLARITQHSIQNDPSVIQGLVQDQLNQHLAPLQQQMQQEQQRAQTTALYNKFPEAKQGTPEHEATLQFIDQNPWIVQAAAQNGGNAAELAYKLGTWDIMHQKLAGMNNRLGEKQQKAQTARPGSGSNATIKDDGTPQSAIALAVQDMAARGITVDQARVDAALAATQREQLF